MSKENNNWVQFFLSLYTQLFLYHFICLQSSQEVQFNSLGLGDMFINFMLLYLIERLQLLDGPDNLLMFDLVKLFWKIHCYSYLLLKSPVGMYKPTVAVSVKCISSNSTGRSLKQWLVNFLKKQTCFFCCWNYKNCWCLELPFNFLSPSVAMSLDSHRCLEFYFF